MTAVPRLHVVTDDEVLTRSDFEQQARALFETAGPALAFHLRGPRTSGRRLYDLALALKTPADEAGSVLIVNDRVDVAVGAGLNAVHLGRRSLCPTDVSRFAGRLRLGSSCHGACEVVEARGFGASWIILGNLFETATHPDRKGLGVDRLKILVEAAGSVPVLAIGGVTPARVEAVLRSGAHGIAVLSGIWSTGSPRADTSKYISALEAFAGGA